MVFNVRPNQVFLKDDTTLKLIASLVEGDILEIGGGHGELTKHLLGRGKITVIEIDAKLAVKLKKLNETKLIVGDALKESFDGYDFVVGNIPYNISSQIIIKFLDSNSMRAIFTIQRELAERMVAEPCSKDYSRLSVRVQSAGKCRILRVLPPVFFSPEPKVFSAVVEIEKTKKNALSDFDKRIVDLIFQHKNQNIGKVLKREGFKTTEDPVFLKKARCVDINDIKKISSLVEFI